MNPYRAISVEIVHHGYASFIVLALHLEQRLNMELDLQSLFALHVT
jgi:hypothetical protein